MHTGRSVSTYVHSNKCKKSWNTKCRYAGPNALYRRNRIFLGQTEYVAWRLHFRDGFGILDLREKETEEIALLLTILGGPDTVSV